MPGLTLLLAMTGYSLTGGYPWGIDNGVKRIAARSFSESGFQSVLINPQSANQFGSGYFPIPQPFVQQTESGNFQMIFPSLWAEIGGFAYRLIGGFGFSLVSALCFVLFTFYLFKLLRYRVGNQLALAGTVIVGLSTLFYGITFWEHNLALLLILPLVFLFQKEAPKFTSLFFAGLAAGISSYLRPEMLLFSILALIVLLLLKRLNGKYLLLTACGILMALILMSMLEKVTCQRWYPPQGWYNLHLSFTSSNLLNKFSDSMNLFLDSPIPLSWFASLITALILTSFFSKRIIILGIGLPLLVVAATGLALISNTPYALIASSQGLLYAIPWIVIGFLPVKGEKIWNDPLFWIGGLFLIGIYTLGLDTAGMHWGPRFVLPATLPLILRTLRVMDQLPKNTSRILFASFGLVAVLQASLGIAAIIQRAQTNRQIMKTIGDTECDLVVLQRWYEGADLEPLWGKKDLVWANGKASFEELLIKLKTENYQEFCLVGEKEMNWIDTFPLESVAVYGEFRQAGWNCFLQKVKLLNKDRRWAEIYWHSALRTAEKKKWDDAFTLFEQALQYDSQNPDLLYDYAVCLGRAGFVQEAMYNLRKVLAIDPQHQAARALADQLGMP